MIFLALHFWSGFFRVENSRIVNNFYFIPDYFNRDTS